VVKRVLFLSGANSARSQMAEGFLRALAGDAFEAYSAGSASRELHPLAVAVMAERGIDIADQRSKAMQEYLGKAQFEFLITVCDRAEKECPMFPGVGTREYWPLDDLVERRYKPVVELSREST
jgi:arsenate reductase